MRRLAAALIAATLLVIPAAQATDPPAPAAVERALSRTLDRLEDRTGLHCTIGYDRTAPYRWRIDLRCYPYGRSRP